MNGQEWSLIQDWLSVHGNQPNVNVHEGCDCDECEEAVRNNICKVDRGIYTLGEGLLCGLIDAVTQNLFDATTSNYQYIPYLTKTFGKIREEVIIKTKKQPNLWELTGHFELRDEFPELKRAIKRIEKRWKKTKYRAFCQSIYNISKKEFIILVFTNPRTTGSLTAD